MAHIPMALDGDEMKSIVAIVLMFGGFGCFADTYQFTVGWTTPTWNPSDTPSYLAKYRVNGGAETLSPVLTSPSWTVSLTANPETL